MRSKLAGESRLNSGDVYIGRGSRRAKLVRSKWCNPFPLAQCTSRADCLRRFERYARQNLLAYLPELCGATLRCHCEDHLGCHGDVLIRLFKRHVLKASFDRDVNTVLDAADVNDVDQPLGSAGAIDGVYVVDDVGVDAGDQVQIPADASKTAEVVDIVGVAAAQRIASEITILLLFPDRLPEFSVASRLGALAERLSLKIAIDTFDTAANPDQDLCDESVWSRVVKGIAGGRFQAALLSPPSSTFGQSHCRRDPRPLRDCSACGLYGITGLSARDKERVRVATLCAVRAAHAAKLCHQEGIPWAVVQPAQRTGCSHLFLLSEWKEALALPGVHIKDFVQCELGCKFEKASVMAGTLLIPGLPERCTHSPRWIRGPKGTWAFASHPTPPECENGESVGHPAGLVEMFATSLLKGAIGRNTATLRQATVDKAIASKRRKSMAVQDQVVFTVPLRGPHSVPESQRRRQDELALGGLRDPWRAVEALPDLAVAGKMVRESLEDLLLANPGVMRRCLEAIASNEPDAGPSESDLDLARRLLLKVFDLDSDATSDHLSPSPVRWRLLQAWQLRANDPDDQVPQWFARGAPAGLDLHPVPCGIFPVSHEGWDADAMQYLDQPVEDFVNYTGIEEDPDVWDEVQSMVKKGWLTEHTSYQDVQQALGATPILSKIGMIIKATGGKVKKRLIVDSKQSGVAKAAFKPERIVLPRLSDVVEDALFQLREARSRAGTHSLEWLVLDFASAFFTVPLAPEEQRFFVIHLRSRFFIFRVLAMGAATSPLVWGRVAALVTRLTQGMFPSTVLALQTFVDDPCVCITGSPAARDLCCALLILTWRCLGFPLAFHKGQRGNSVAWIGNKLLVEDDVIIATIKPEILKELEAQIEQVLKSNVVSIRLLRSLAGRANHVASLLRTWRPFLQQLWGALSATGRCHAPAGCIWTKQVAPALWWLRAFLAGARGTVVRSFALEVWANWVEPVCVTIDASPYGLGGMLEFNDSIVEWFASELSIEDFERFGHRRGQAAGQQTWECLAALVALRCWTKFWRNHRVRLTVRGDSVAMLTMLCKLKPSASQPLGLIAREVALDIAEATFEPDI